MDELRNEITGGAIPASFEPSIDYVVTKIPRFAFEKFPQANDRLTTQMKSVGEVMAIGRTFQESLQKALRGLEIGVDGLNETSVLERDDVDIEEIITHEMRFPGPDRLWYVADAFRFGMSIDQVFDICKIDRWFLAQIEDLVRIEQELTNQSLDDLSAGQLRQLKTQRFCRYTPGNLVEKRAGHSPCIASPLRYLSGLQAVLIHAQLNFLPVPLICIPLMSKNAKHCQLTVKKSLFLVAARIVSVKVLSLITVAFMPQWQCVKQAMKAS